ncbi:MAG: hypothetical protein U5L11_00350 [Arhodomonas sp.]|nr:hypothetical protein [Arhodomonas sp.]
MAVGWLWYAGFFTYPLIPAAAAAFAAAGAILRWCRDGRTTALIAAGMLTTIAALFRHDVGAYTALAILAAGIAPAPRPRGRAASIYLAVVLAGGLPFAAYLLASVPVAQLWEQLIIFPASVYPAMRSLPFPDPIAALGDMTGAPADARLWAHRFPDLLLPLTPVVLAVAGITGLLACLRRPDDTTDTAARARLLLGFLGLLLFAKGLVRPGVLHMLPAVLLVSPLLLSWAFPAAAVERGRIPPPWRWATSIAVAVFAIPPLAAGWNSLGSGEPTAHTLLGVEARYGASLPQGIPRARGFIVPADMAAAVRFVQARTAPDEPIFVALGRHDRVFVNDLLFYFLADRPPASRYVELHPGAVTEAAVQREIITDLAASRPPYVIRWMAPPRREPNASARSSGNSALDEFLDTEYRVVQELGEYRILARQGLAKSGITDQARRP